MTRSCPIPAPGGTLLHVIGDTHFGNFFSVRQAKVLADMNKPFMPKPIARIHVGDIVENGLTSEDTDAQTWFSQIPSAPTFHAIGNHDHYLGVRSVASWATAWGYESKNHSHDVGENLRLVFVGPDVYPGDGYKYQLTQTTLDYLAAQLSGTSRSCVVVCHYPLYNTVLGGSGQYQSTDDGFWVRGPNNTDDTEIREVLDAYSNCRAWVCGHTHSSIESEGFIKSENVGSRVIAHINASAIVYVGKTHTVFDAIRSLFLTVRETTIEVRCRDHGAGIWYGPAGQRVSTVTA